MPSSKHILGGFTAFLCLLVQGALGSDDIQQEISFGQHGHHVWTDDHRHVAGFTLNGSPGHHPELMSDRIIMTPPWPGNIRGSIWADQPEHDETFSATLEFRATGSEHGSGNLQLWYVNQPHSVAESSIYTVGAFDGLAIVIDQVAGHGGSIRGFLNDGHTSYKDHHHVDSLPFGHCNYPYRNTGHYVSLELKQTKKDVEVLVDGHRCFHTKKVKLHTGYHFGLTAASAEQPDSIEVKSFIVRGPTHHELGHHDQDHHDPVHATHHEAGHVDPAHHYEAAAGAHHDAVHVEPYSDDHHGRDHKDAADPYATEDWHWVPESEHIKDAPASEFKTDEKRFEDLHARVQLLGHASDNIYHDLSLLKEEHERMHGVLQHMLERIEHVVDRIQNDVETKEYKEHLAALSRLVAESHQTVMHGIPAHMTSVMETHNPRLGFFLFIFIASQVGLLASYVVYQRRLNNQPKKYL